MAIDSFPAFFMYPIVYLAPKLLASHKAHSSPKPVLAKSLIHKSQHSFLMSGVKPTNRLVITQKLTHTEDVFSPTN